MRFLIAVILLLFSADAQVTIDGDVAHRHLSQELIELAGFLGCASGCTFKPLNIPQLAVCTATTHLGDKLNLLFRCGVENGKNDCEAKSELDVPNAPKCVWVPIPTSWEENLGATHFCLPTIVSDNKIAFLGTLSAFKPLFESFKELQANDIPEDTSKVTIVYLMGCLDIASRRGSKCTDSAGGVRPCAPCDIIQPKYYPGIGTTSLCLPTTVAEIACPLINKSATDAERPYCPLKDPKANLPKDCTSGECPPPVACPAN